MSGIFTKDEIKWIKQYREDNECGLQEAKRVLLINRIRTKMRDNLHVDPDIKSILEDILELIR